MSAFAEAVSDGRVIAWRNLKRIPRIPELAIFAVLQSIMFVLLFAFVFGGAIPLPGGGSYREYLMPGIYIQTLAFASITTAIGMADDMSKGLIDRFRSLPMARSAVLSGRTSADVVYNAGILVVLMLSGLVVGWRVHGPVRPDRDAPRDPAADRGMESGQLPRLRDARPLRQSESVPLGLVARPACAAALVRLDDRPADRVRTPRGAPLSLHRALAVLSATP